MELKLNAADLENPHSSMTHLEPPAVPAGKRCEGECPEHVLSTYYALIPHKELSLMLPDLTFSDNSMFNGGYYSIFRDKETEAHRYRIGAHT